MTTKHISLAAALFIAVLLTSGCEDGRAQQSGAAGQATIVGIDPYNDPDGFITPARAEIEHTAPLLE